MKDAQYLIDYYTEDMETKGRFDKATGIYDRYKKDIEKYLNSIGGKPYTDDQGHTWIEVPVEPHRKRPIMYGQRGQVDISGIGDALDNIRNGEADLKALGRGALDDTEVKSAVHPELQKLGVTEKIVELFTKWKDIQNRPHIKDDPYLASTGNKAADTRAFNALYKELQKAGVDMGTAVQKMSNLYDVQGKDSLGGPGKNQRGMVQLPFGQRGQADVFNNMPWVKGKLGAFEPMQATPAEVIEMAKGKPDIERSITQQFLVDPWTAGGRYFSERMGNHPAVRFTMDTMIGKDRVARQKVMDVIHDKYAPAARELSDAELTSVWRVIDEGDRLKQELSLRRLS